VKGDPVNVLVLILVGSFAIDRIVAGLLFLLSFNKAWNRRFPEPLSVQDGPKRIHAEKKQKLVYVSLAAVLAIVLLAGFGNIRVLAALGVQPRQESAAPANPASGPAVAPAGQPPAPVQPPQGTPFYLLLDIFLTGLVLVGGADRISAILKEHGVAGGEKSGAKPVEITGKLILQDEAGTRTLTGSIGA